MYEFMQKKTPATFCSNPQTQLFHSYRTSGCYCYYRDSGRNSSARVAEGERDGTGDPMCEQSFAGDQGADHVFPRLQRVHGFYGKIWQCIQFRTVAVHPDQREKSNRSADDDKEWICAEKSSGVPEKCTSSQRCQLGMGVVGRLRHAQHLGQLVREQCNSPLGNSEICGWTERQISLLRCGSH